jgi:hypothetical protein
MEGSYCVEIVNIVLEDDRRERRDNVPVGLERPPLFIILYGR